MIYRFIILSWIQEGQNTLNSAKLPTGQFVMNTSDESATVPDLKAKIAEASKDNFSDGGIRVKLIIFYSF